MVKPAVLASIPTNVARRHQPKQRKASVTDDAGLASSDLDLHESIVRRKGYRSAVQDENRKTAASSNSATLVNSTMSQASDRNAPLQAGLKRKKGEKPAAIGRIEIAEAKHVAARPVVRKKRLSCDDSPTGRTALGRSVRTLRLDEDQQPDDVPSSPSRTLRGGRTRSQSQVAEDSEDASVSEEDSDEEAGDERDQRLLNVAPSWQLSKLKKRELIRLHHLLGTWTPGDEDADPSAYTKQELVDSVISARDVTSGRSSPTTAGDTDSLKPRFRGNRSRYPSQSDENRLQPGSLPSRSSSYSLRTRKTSASQVSIVESDQTSEYTDADSDQARETVNYAGGEETEAEVITKSLGRRKRTITDSPQKEVTRASKAAASLKAIRKIRRSDVSTSSLTSATLVGRSSNGGTRRLRPHGVRKGVVFAASSPLRTRARARNGYTSSVLRRSDSSLGVGSRLGAGSSRSGHSTTSPLTSEGEEEQGDDVMMISSPPKERLAKLRAKKSLTEVDNTLSSRNSDEGSNSDASADAGDDERGGGARRPRNRALRPRTRSESSSGLTSLEEEPQDMKARRSVILEDEDSEAPSSPHKIRRLHDGKVLLSSGTTKRISRSSSFGPDSDEESTVPDEDDDVGDLTYRPPVSLDSDVDMVDQSMLEREESSREIEVDCEAEPSSASTDPLDQPTSASLNRLLKAEILQLCEARGLSVDKEQKKTELVQALLDSVQARELGDSDSSITSISTAKASSTASTTSARSNDRQRGKAARDDVDTTPLLLRSQEKSIQETQPPTPALTPTNEDAQPAEAVDELNGLDLESLNLLDKEITPNKLEKLDKIGSGGFKDVYVGKYKVSKSRSMKVAIADIRDQLTEMDIKELSLLRDLRHENIVRFIGVSIPDDPKICPCMIVSELCSNGDVFDYIRNVPPPSDVEIFRILLDIARGLEYLHTRKPAIIHRDVKSTNVLITRNRTAKINDFGLARVKNTTRSVIRSLVGTVNWQAVELWVPKPHYNEKVDVWSAGMTFWEVLQWHQVDKRYPFQGMNEHQIYQDVGQKRHRPVTGTLRRQYGGEIVDLIDKMWDQNPKDRPSMTEVCTSLEELVELKKQAG